jgi:hypothetical protein
MHSSFVLSLASPNKGPVIGGGLSSFGLYVIWLVVGALVVVDGLLRFLISEPLQKRLPSSSSSSSPLPSKSSFMVVMRDIEVQGLCMVGALPSFVCHGLYTVLPLYYERRFELSTFWFSVLMTVWAAAFALFTPLVGWLSDKYENRRTEQMAIGAVVGLEGWRRKRSLPRHSFHPSFDQFTFLSNPTNTKGVSSMLANVSRTFRLVSSSGIDRSRFLLDLNGDSGNSTNKSSVGSKLSRPIISW